MTLSWIGSDGYTATFDGSSGIEIAAGVLGIDAPPVELSTSPYLSADGSVLVKQRRGIRRLVLPLLFVGEAPTGARAVMAELLRSLVAGGTLRYTGANTRDLRDVYYESGAGQGNRLQDGGVFVDDVYPISLLAMDPWWYGESSVLVLNFGTEVPFDDASVTFDASIGFDGTDTNPVIISGDAEAFPITTIDGPFTTLQVGIAGGLTFELAAPLAAGDRIVVDTRPGNRGPRRNGGDVDWSLLTPESRLWTLPIGSSVLNAGATGDTGASLIEVAWQQRFLTP